jgi:hypothetical protein
MIKLKDIIKESKWSDRKWGEPLPTLEDVMREASQDDDDAYVHVGGGTYKEKNRGTGEPLPNSPSYIKKDSGGFEMVDDDDPRLSKGDDDEDDTPKKPAPDSRSDKGKDRVHVNPFDDRFGSKDADDEEEPSGGDLDYSRDSGEPEDKPHGGDTGKDADYGGGDFTKSADYDMWSDDDELAISGTDSDDPAGGKGDAWMTGDDAKQKGMDRASGLANKGMEKRPGGKQAEIDYQKADQMIKKFAGVDIEKAEYWAKKKKQAADAMMGEITIDGKKYKPITESINPTVYDPNKEIKRAWNKISLRQFDRKWKKEII